MRDLIGKNVFITGANTGIGLATATALASRGAQIFFAGRSAEKNNQAIDTVKQSTGNTELHFLPLDYADLATVKPCAEAFLKRDIPLHVLINNAGLAGATTLSKQGFEMTFAVNHLGPFLLTQLLKPGLERGAPSRVVNVASRASERIDSFSLDFISQPARSRVGLKEYAHSKLANVLFTVESARRWDDTHTHFYALHPGVIASDIWRGLPWPVRTVVKWFMKTPEQGATSSLHCATSREVAAHNGRYYDEYGRERRANPLSQDVALAKTLWEKSEALVAPFR